MGIPANDMRFGASGRLLLMLIMAVGLLTGSSRSGHATVSSPYPAAILIYPEISFESGTRDTIIELSNIRDDPVTVLCVYVNALGQCSSDPIPCATDDDCPGGGVCVSKWLRRDFSVRMTPRQALGWKAGEGLLQLPCDTLAGGCASGEENQGAIPPVATDPFRGELKCVELSNNDEKPPLVPVARNDLIGSATIIESALPSARSYAPIAIEATGPNDGDQNLCLGQTSTGECESAEYAPCPAFLTVNHFFEDAVVEGAAVRSSIVLTPCSENIDDGTPAGAQVKLLVSNEFEQEYDATIPITCWEDFDLDSLPLFSVGFQGTLTGQTRIRGVKPDGSGSQSLIGLVSEHHGLHGASYHLTGMGLNEEGDIIRLPAFELP